MTVLSARIHNIFWVLEALCSLVWLGCLWPADAYFSVYLVTAAAGRRPFWPCRC